jgi:hypothetical protein
MNRQLLVLLLLLSPAIAGCGGNPFVLLPGGALDGTPASHPESWAFTDDIETIQLESNPAEPYSVNIWVIALDDDLYVHAGTNRAAWVENMETDPNVRLQAEASVYELTAARVTEQASFDRFSDAYEKKYGRRPGNENAGEAYLFELRPR